MWEQLHSAGGGLAVVGVLVIIFVGAAIFAVRHAGDTPPDGTKYPWLRLDEVVAIVRSPEWSWTRNSRCKYISVRMDTRTHNNLCVVYDRHGEPITLEELKFQERRRGHRL